MSVKVVCRPLNEWPGKLRADDERKDARFTASWTDTMDLLDREAFHLGASDLVIQLAIGESDIRLDGWPYERAKPRHPGVTVVLPESEVGRVSWSTDLYGGGGWRGYGKPRMPGWQCNVRAVALTMEALRVADRHGIMQGRQYAGFREIGSGIAMEPPMTVESAAAFIANYASDESVTAADVIASPDVRALAFRQAAKRLHPDAGGDPDLFRRLDQSRVLVEKHGVDA